MPDTETNHGQAFACNDLLAVMGHRCPAPRHRLPPRNPRPQRQPIPQSGKRCAGRLHGSETPDRMRTKYHIIPAKPAAQCGWRLKDPAPNPATPDGTRKHRASPEHLPPITAEAWITPLSTPQNHTGRGDPAPWPDGHSDGREYSPHTCPRRTRRRGEPKPGRKTSLRLWTAFQWPRFRFRNAIPGAEPPTPPGNRPPITDDDKITPRSIPQRRMGCGQNVISVPENRPPSRTTIQWLQFQSRNAVWGADKMSYHCRKTGNPLRTATKRPPLSSPKRRTEPRD